MLEEGRGPRVPRSKGSKVQGSQGPGYLKLIFKYELDSKEGPSCEQFVLTLDPSYDIGRGVIKNTIQY